MILKDLPYLKNYLKKTLLSYCVISIAIMIGSTLIIGFEVQMSILIFGSLIWSFVFYLLPSIIIINNYLSENYNSKFHINGDSFFYEKGDKKYVFTENDINIFHIYESINQKKFSVWSPYWYSKIELNEGDVIYITCFLVDKPDVFINKSSIVRYKKALPLIYQNQSLKSGQEKTSNRRLIRLKKTYKLKTTKELESVLSNKSGFDKEVYVVIEQILKERSPFPRD